MIVAEYATSKCTCYKSTTNNNHMTLYFISVCAALGKDDKYYAAIDTNNGTESQNKLFKHSFLPRKKHRATPTSTVSIIVDNFQPEDSSTCYKTTNNRIGLS